MKITPVVALFLNIIKAADPPTSGNFFYIDFPDLAESSNAHTHGQHEVRMQALKKDSKIGSIQTYPLFVTTQQSTLGLFSTACSDCRSTKKFDGSKAVGYTAGDSKTQGTTEWVNVYDKNVSELEAFNFNGNYGT